MENPFAQLHVCTRPLKVKTLPQINASIDSDFQHELILRKKFVYFRHMKYRLILILLSATVLHSCALFKTKCTQIDLKTEHADIVQASGEGSMYSFQIREGKLAGSLLHCNFQGADGDKSVFIINTTKSLVSEPIEKELWKVEEKKDQEKQWVEMSGNLALQIDGKVYCFSLQYEGAMMKHPSPPVPVPLPHQE